MGLGRRIPIRIFNGVYLALTGVAIGALCTQPIVSLSTSITLPAETLSDILESVIGNNDSEGEPQEETKVYLPSIKREGDISSLGEYINPDVIKNEIGDITISINDVAIPASACFKLGNANYLQDLILSKESGVLHKAIDDASASVAPTFKRIIKVVALGVASKEVKDQITSKLDEFKTGDAVTSELYEQIGGDETVNAITENIYNLLDNAGEEGVAVDNLVDTLLNGTEENPEGIMTILEDLKEQEVPGFSELNLETDIDKEEIQEQLIDALQNIPGLVSENEDGETVISSLDDALAALLGMLTGSTQDSGENKEEQTEQKEEQKEEEQKEEETKKVLVRAETNNGSSDSKLQKQITDLIESKIPDAVWNIDLSLGGFTPYILFGLIALSIAPWAIFGLVTLIRTLRIRKCWTKPWIIFVFAFIQMVLTVGTVVALKYLLPLGKNLLTPSLGQYGDIANTLTLSVNSSIAIPGIIYLVMIPLSIAYAIICKKEKKQFKADKKAKKAAKKAA